MPSSSLSLFLSTGWMLSFSVDFLKCLILFLLRVVLFSSLFWSFMLPPTSSLLPLPRSFRVLSFRGCSWVSIVFFLVCLSAPRVPFLSTLAIAFHSRSFFADPLSPVRSRSSLFYLPSGCFVFLYTVFLLGPVVGPRFYVPIDSFILPFLGLVFFFFLFFFLFRCFVRLPSLSAGGEGLGGASHPSSRVPVCCGATWLLTCPLWSLGSAHSPLWC